MKWLALFALLALLSAGCQDETKLNLLMIHSADYGYNCAKRGMTQQEMHKAMAAKGIR